jgi:UDP-N-acetylglucosamine 2-epimerase (non-hydrolysing)
MDSAASIQSSRFTEAEGGIPRYSRMAARSKKLRLMIVFGTRPEVIKLAPVIAELRKHPRTFSTVTCFTAQHRHMCEGLLRFFSIEPDYDLNIMTEKQSLMDIATRTMRRLDGILAREKPDMVIVQGDTTSAFASALLAFYRHIPVGHVEAGLRTNNIWNPYPEEINLHFAPTRRAARALRDEGLRAGDIFVTGNTVIDALHLTLALMKGKKSGVPARRRSRSGASLILVTAHRRENFGKGIDEICAALLDLVKRNDNVEILLPVHPNPAVKRPVERALSSHPRIILSPPLEYMDLVRIMDESSIVLTDSGGLQEEAPALGKPVIVMRDETERPEIVEAGGAVLAGPHRKRIVAEVERILKDRAAYERMAHVRNPFGDGYAARRIVKIISARLGRRAVDVRTLRREAEFKP